MKKVKMLSVLAALVLAVSMCGCADQHPDESSDAASSMEQTDEYKLAATSPAVVDICDKLDLDLAGVCTLSLSTIPESMTVQKNSAQQCPPTQKYLPL